MKSIDIIQNKLKSKRLKMEDMKIINYIDKKNDNRNASIRRINKIQKKLTPMVTKVNILDARTPLVEDNFV